MSDIAPKARLVHITCEKGKAGLLYASSPDLRGLLVAEQTVDGMRQAIPNAIRDLYAAMGVEVVVGSVESYDGLTWVAFPAEIARQALRKESA